MEMERPFPFRKNTDSQNFRYPKAYVNSEHRLYHAVSNEL